MCAALGESLLIEGAGLGMSRQSGFARRPGHAGSSCTASRTASRFWSCQLFSDLFGPDLIVDLPNKSVFVEVSGQA